MSEPLSIKIEGLRELEKKMIALGPKISRDALKSALVAGGAVIRKEARSQAPTDTGTLKSAMYIKRMPKFNPFQEKVIFGVRNGRKTWKKGQDGKYDKSKDAFYWKFLEFGTKFIKPASFIRNAFESKKEAAMTRIKSVLADKIKKLSKEPA